MTYQLRDYRIKTGELSEWIGEWRTLVYPLRVKMGFRIVGAWVVEEENRFLWILGWEGPLEVSGRRIEPITIPQSVAH